MPAVTSIRTTEKTKVAISSSRIVNPLAPCSKRDFLVIEPVPQLHTVGVSPPDVGPCFGENEVVGIPGNRQSVDWFVASRRAGCINGAGCVERTCWLASGRVKTGCGHRQAGRDTEWRRRQEDSGRSGCNKALDLFDL